MGLRKDLDSTKTRYIYYLMDKEKIIYVGTAVNPKSRYKTHCKRIKTDTSLLYRYCRIKNIVPLLKIKKKLIGTYENAEVEEIKHINKHNDTVLNFYNNNNKKQYYKLSELYKC